MAPIGTPAYDLNRSAELEPLLTVMQCCALLQVSKQTLYRLINNGELEPIRVGHRPRFMPATVRAYLERHRDGAGP